MRFTHSLCSVVHHPNLLFATLEVNFSHTQSLCEIFISQTMKKKKTKAKFHWMIFADSYLTTALITFKELKEPKHFDKDSLEYQLAYKSKYLLITTVWNFKHAIEITIKSLSILLEEHYMPVHNLEDLAQNLVDLLDKKRIKPPEKMQELFIIILKYHYLKFWDSKLIKTGKFSDDYNDFLRYPDSQVKTIINLHFFDEIKQHELDELWTDMQIFRSVSNELNNTIITKIG